MAQASQQGTSATGTLGKGSRITGADRDTLGAQLAERYQAGESIRALAEDTGRSFGFVHGVIKEAGVTLRARGGATRGPGRSTSTRPPRTTTTTSAAPTKVATKAPTKAAAKKVAAKIEAKVKDAKPSKKAVEVKADAKDGKKAKSGGKKKGKGR